MYRYPLNEREVLLLGDWVVREARPENRPLWHYELEGATPSKARSVMRSFGYYLSVEDLMYVVGRKR